MSNDNPREYTHEEIRQQVYAHIHNMVKYWENENREPLVKVKLEGLAFSILALIDGDTELPGFSLVPRPCKEDKDYHKSEGENWYPFTKDLKNDICHGEMHSEFLNFKKEKA
jgi:hypothetical protein